MSDQSKLRLIQDPGLLEMPPDSELVPQRQWLPRSVAYAVKLLLLPFVLVDVACRKIARMLIRPPLVRTGSCKQRGNCCYFITVRKEKGALDVLSRFWMQQVHGFYLREKKTYEINGRAYYVMGCRYLQKNGSCGQYRVRPMICREWPKVEIFGHPQILKGCGYSFKARNPQSEPFVSALRSSQQNTDHS